MSPFPSNDEVNFFRLYREQIVNEDTLIYHRMSWFLIVQTILFVLWAAVLKSPPQSGPYGALTAGMSVFGMLSCIPALLGVSAAQSAITNVRAQYEKNHPGRPHPALPAMVGNLDHHLLGKWTPRLVIGLCFGGWVAVLKVFG